MPKFNKVDEFHRGWLIGDFLPSLVRVKDFEICVISHQKGEDTQPHYHTDSEEINVVISGRLRVGNAVLEKGDIFIYEKYEVSDVEFMEDSELVVIRMPSSPSDKVVV